MRLLAAARYVLSWFLVDLAATFPWEAVASTGWKNTFRLLRLLRLVRLLKDVRLDLGATGANAITRRLLMVSLGVLARARLVGARGLASGGGRLPWPRVAWPGALRERGRLTLTAPPRLLDARSAAAGSRLLWLRGALGRLLVVAARPL